MGFDFDLTEHLTWIVDPGHGWLRAPLALLSELGISREEISAWSYESGMYAYLEEDSDAMVLLSRLGEARPDIPVKHIEDFERTYMTTGKVHGWRAYAPWAVAQ